MIFTTQEPKTCVYCGTKEDTYEYEEKSYLGNRTVQRSSFGNCSAKGLDCCNKCWSLKYPSSRISSTSISAAGITHEHSLMKCHRSFVDSKPLKFKFPRLAELLPNFLAGEDSMTVSELDLGNKTAAEAVEALHDNADKLNGEESKDETELLVEKLASIADKEGVNVAAIKVASDERFSEEERKLFTAAVQERAERRFGELVQAAVAKQQAKYKDDPCPILPKREDGYWIDSSNVTPDVPEQGPYDTKKEAEEYRGKLIKLYKQEQKKAETNGNRKSLKEKAAEIHNPNADHSVESADPSEESEKPVSTKSSKKPAAKKPESKKAEAKKSSKPSLKATKAAPKGKAKAAKPKAEKKPKAPKVPRADKSLSCIEAAVQVLKAAKNPLTVPEIYAEMLAKKLWSAGGGSRGEGKTPIPTINAKLCLEMQNKGKESRVKRVGVGKYEAA